MDYNENLSSQNNLVTKGRADKPHQQEGRSDLKDLGRRRLRTAISILLWILVAALELVGLLGVLLLVSTEDAGVGSFALYYMIPLLVIGALLALPAWWLWRGRR